MKVIGLIGGMSWESTQEYYRIINEEVNKRLGGLHSARCVIYSVDFAQIERLQREGKWQELTDIMVDAAKCLEKASADCIVICTNTMHKMAEDVQNAVKIPLLHLADATAELIQRDGLDKVGLLGTKFTMEQEFYKGRLTDKFGIKVIIPNDDERAIIHKVIYDELCLGKINANSKEKYIEIIRNLVKNGAEGIILGCTEISLLISQKDVDIPIYDTTEIHACAAVEFALD